MFTGSFLAVLVATFAVAHAILPDTAEAAPELRADTRVATAGFYQLRWFADSPVELEESQNENFGSPHVVYRGSDAARVMSGKPDGVFYYRVRDTDDGSVSNVVEITVRHHSLERAVAFFSLGAVVFLATLLLIATGARSRDDRP